MKEMDYTFRPKGWQNPYKGWAFRRQGDKIMYCLIFEEGAQTMLQKLIKAGIIDELLIKGKGK